MSASVAQWIEQQPSNLKVIAYTVNTKAAADAQLARGCVEVFSGDPWKVSGQYPPERSLDLSQDFPAPGMAHNGETSVVSPPSNGSQVVVVQNEELLVENKTGRGMPNCIKLGSLGAWELGGTVTVRLWAQAVRTENTSNPENSWLFGVYLGKQTGDEAVNEEPNDSMWRLAMVRRKGNKNVYERRTMTGGIVNLGQVAAPSTPYAKAGGRSIPMLFEVAFTPSSVALRNIPLNDTDLVVSASALAIPGAYLTLNVNGAVSRIWGE